jgi:hypothetical protein
MGGMNDWLTVELTRERNARMLAEAEERRLAAGASVHASTLARALARVRARAARKLFGFAFALEREETWRAVWERLEAPKHP